jgi:hypothetical protein
MIGTILTVIILLGVVYVLFNLVDDESHER